MNINLTLIGQSITFFVFVWFCYAYIWPPLVKALEDRKARIADGLAAAERGKHEQELAEQRAIDEISKAKQQAAEIISKADKRAGEIVEEAKDAAKAEGERLIHAAQAEVEQEANRAREQLRGQVAALAVAGAEKVLNREVDANAHQQVLDELAAQL